MIKSRNFKRLWGKPWDYVYLLELEQKKIREMCKYFQKSQLTVDWEFQVRDLKLCDKLIDIVLEKDKYYRSWLDNNYNDKDRENLKYISYPVYINIKNSRRFLPLADYNCNSVKSHPRLMDVAKISLKQKKALHLYNKIRTYRMEYWWS